MTSAQRTGRAERGRRLAVAAVGLAAGLGVLAALLEGAAGTGARLPPRAGLVARSDGGDGTAERRVAPPALAAAVPHRRAEREIQAADPAPPLHRPPSPGSERSHEVAWLRRAGSEGFVARARETLGSGAPIAEKVGLLRAWVRSGVEPAWGGFAQVLAQTSQPEALRDFAFRTLDEAAERDGGARAVLLAHLQAAPDDPRDRARAAFTVLRTGEDAEVRRCVDAVFGEPDRGVLQRVGAALRERGTPRARAAVHRLLFGCRDLEARRALLGEIDE